MAMKSDIYVATESFSIPIDGVVQQIHKGLTRVREGHPLLKAAPDYFAPIDTSVHYEMEQATAAPGEKRNAPPLSDKAIDDSRTVPADKAVPATPKAAEKKNG
jgi:hypothetical protein